MPQNLNQKPATTVNASSIRSLSKFLEVTSLAPVKAPPSSKGST